VAALDAEKRATLTPAQILRELAKTISLPAPITLQPDQAASAVAPRGEPAHADASPAPSSRVPI
jgi:hypothetical protein